MPGQLYCHAVYSCPVPNPPCQPWRYTAASWSLLPTQPRTPSCALGMRCLYIVRIFQAIMIMRAYERGYLVASWSSSRLTDRLDGAYSLQVYHSERLVTGHAVLAAVHLNTRPAAGALSIQNHPHTLGIQSGQRELGKKMSE